MRDNKNTKIDIRMSIQEKEQLKEYAAAAGMSISEFVRMAIYHQIGGKK